MNIIKEIRKSIVNMSYYSKASHIGSSLSIVEILYTLYFHIMNIDPNNPKDPNRDKLILSKAHGSTGLYATLAERGFIPKEYLKKYYINDGILPGHIDRESLDCLEASSGSLGHGLSIGIGMAVANKVTRKTSKIYIILGDGECNEGSIWEGVMFASTKKLDNLVVIVDFNKYQGFGDTNNVINQVNLADRWQAFGWDVHETDGHNIENLKKLFKIPQDRPKVIIANTIKGKGFSFMEDKFEWHYKSPNEEQYQQAIGELD